MAHPPAMNFASLFGLLDSVVTRADAAAVAAAVADAVRVGHLPPRDAQALACLLAGLVERLERPVEVRRWQQLRSA